MRVLAVTNMYPTAAAPTLGTFVKEQVKSLRGAGLNVELCFVDRVQKGPKVYCGLGRRIKERVSQSKPDIIHVMYGGVMADRVTAAMRDLPVLVSFCGSDLLGENLSGIARRFISRFGVWCSHRAALRAAGNIVKSKNLRNALPYDLPESKIRILPNGVDLRLFSPHEQEECRRQLGWDGKAFHVLFPANTGDPVKQPALARLAVEHLRALNVRAELHFLKGVPHHQVPVWLNAAHAVLLTSKQEGSPNIIKEALACNVPVVSLDVGDVAERIQGIDGCHLAHPEPADIAAKLWLVYRGPRRVRSRASIQEFATEQVAQRLSRFYEETLSAWKRTT